MTTGTAEAFSLLRPWLIRLQFPEFSKNIHHTCDMFFFTPGTLKDALPAIELITRAPGRVLSRGALIANGILLALTLLLLARDSHLFVITMFITACVGLFSTLIFIWRRERLQKAVDKWRKEQKTTIDGESISKPGDYSEHYAGTPFSPSADVVIIDDNGSYTDPFPGNGTYRKDDEQLRRDDRIREAASEARTRRNTWMPGVEAAQRSAIAAAGGVANAPYLKDDLRVTILATIVTFLSVPLNFFFSFIALFMAL